MSRAMIVHSVCAGAQSSLSSRAAVIRRSALQVVHKQMCTARRSALRCTASDAKIAVITGANTGAARNMPLSVHFDAAVKCSQRDGLNHPFRNAETCLGKISALEMAKQGYSVVLACRSAERAEAAAEDIRADCKAVGLDPSLDVLLLDLASLASVQDFVCAFKGKYDKCDVLMNNAVRPTLSNMRVPFNNLVPPSMCVTFVAASM
eukprot:1166720-Prorocentrum_minimum.AAC.1